MANRDLLRAAGFVSDLVLGGARAPGPAGLPGLTRAFVLLAGFIGLARPTLSLLGLGRLLARANEYASGYGLLWGGGLGNRPDGVSKLRSGVSRSGDL